MKAGGPRLRDESMRAYDMGNIPGLRRPRADDARLLAWINDASPAALERLVATARARPAGSAEAARALRRSLVDARSSAHAARALDVADELTRRVAYFYRYTANARFFAALWGARRHARARVLVLVRAWAEDLGAMFFRRADPPALFWVERYQRKRRSTAFPPLPSAPERPFVYRVAAANRRRLPERGHVLTSDELEASLALLNRLLAAADDARGWRAVAPAARSLAENVRRAVPAGDDYTLYDNPFEDDDDTATLLLPGKPGTAPSAKPSAVGNTRVSALNDKVIAVLRRYDESFARFDPYLTRGGGRRRAGAIHCPDVFGESDDVPHTNITSFSSSSVGPSVAAVAREKARWKLSMSGSGSTIFAADDESSTDTKPLLFDDDLELLVANSAKHTSTDALSFPAVTPATFPDSPFSEDNLGAPSSRRGRKVSKRAISEHSKNHDREPSASSSTSGSLQRSLCRQGAVVFQNAGRIVRGGKRV